MTSSSRANASGPCRATVSASGSRSAPAPPLESALTGTATTLPPLLAGCTTSMAIDARFPAPSTAAMAPVGVSGNVSSGSPPPGSAPSVEL